jgi:hypothetical protein
MIVRWLGRDIAANLAVQKLSHAIKAMNDVLLPWCLSHKCITSARLIRRLDAVAPRSIENHNNDRDGEKNGDNNLDHDDDNYGDADTATRIGCRTNNSSSSSSSSVANADSRANAALRSRSTSPRNALMEEKENEKEKGATPISDGHPVQVDLTSTSLSHRFESWMSFMEITSDLLAKAVTPGFICDSFLSAKMTQDGSHRSGVVPYKHQNVDLIQNLDADHALNGSTTQPSSFSGVEVEDDQLLSRPRKKARSSVKSACMSEKKDSVYDEAEETTGHNSAARHFLRGVMSLEEAASVEEAQEVMRKKKETALQTLINDFYSYSYPVQGSDALKTSTSTSTADHSLEKVRILFICFCIVSCCARECHVISCHISCCVSGVSVILLSMVAEVFSVLLIFCVILTLSLFHTHSPSIDLFLSWFLSLLLFVISSLFPSPSFIFFLNLLTYIHLLIAIPFTLLIFLISLTLLLIHRHLMTGASYCR